MIVMFSLISDMLSKQSSVYMPIS